MAWNTVINIQIALGEKGSPPQVYINDKLNAEPLGG